MAPGAPPSTIAAPAGYRTVVDDTGVVSVAIPVDWHARTTPGVRWTPDGEQFAPWIIVARDAAAPDCDGCDAFFHAPDLHISVSPYEPVSPEAPEDCDAVDVIPFDSHGFTGRREIGGGCDADIERIVASKPGAITVDIQLTYSTSEQGPLSEAERAAIADVFEIALATFEWTGRPFEDVVPVGLPPVTTTQPTPAPPTLCVLADIDFAAVRSAPGTGNPEVGRIPPGTCGVVAVASDHSTGEEWLHVQYDGIDGWSAARLYVPDANAPSATTVPIPDGGAPVSTGLWTFDGDWLDAVPQLGNEPVRGSGCGADGSIGDVIPDGWWFGLVRSSDGAQFGFTLACAYYGESARPHLEECDPDVCVWDESIMPVFPADRIWNVPTRPDIVKELTAACAASAAELEEQSLRDGRNMYSWIHITAGQADYVRYACPFG